MMGSILRLSIWAFAISYFTIVAAQSTSILPDAFNSTLDESANSVNTSNGDRIACRDSSYPPVEFHEYYALLQNIVASPTAMLPVDWYLIDPHRTQVWHYGRTRITLRPIIGPGRDRFQPILVAHMAALIAQKCLTSTSSNRGGITVIGNYRQFYLELSAIPATEETS